MTAQLEGIESAQPTTPTPTAMIARWFPAHVQLPPGETMPGQHTNTTMLVYATDVGLFVFDHRPPSDDNMTGEVWFSPIDWSRTRSGLPAPRIAFEVYTEAGPVKVTPMGGCGCHLRNLKNWHPSWSARSIPWGGA